MSCLHIKDGTYIYNIILQMCILNYSKPFVKVPLLLWIQEIDLDYAKVAPILQKNTLLNK